MDDMRTLMDKVNVTKKLFEMPYLMTATENFGLNDRWDNRNRAARLIATDYHVLHEDDRLVLGDYRDGVDGEIFLYEKATEMLSYFVRYEIANDDRFGQCVTQVALWKSADANLENVARDVFDNYLLSRFDSVLSDDMQTRDGQRFWVTRMAAALRNSKTVGLIVADQFHRYDGSVSLGDWIGELDAWGDQHEHREKIFVITNRVIASS